MERTDHRTVSLETEKGSFKAIYPAALSDRNYKADADREKPIRFPDKYALVPFQVAIAGRSYNSGHSMSWGVCDLSDSFRFRSRTDTEFHGDDYFNKYGATLSSCGRNIIGETVFEYYQEQYQLLVSVVTQYAGDAGVIRCFTKIRNLGHTTVTLVHLSSSYIPGLASEGLKKWYDPSKLTLHYCCNGWHAEGQWREGSLEDLGLYPASSYGINNSVLLHSVGTFSTGRYMPLGILEDKETRSVWYWQIENSSSWYYNIGFRGFADHPSSSLCLECGTCDERYLGWTKELPGDSEFFTPVVSFGTARGGFVDAVFEMTKYRRNCLYPDKAWESELPVCFNDYMNAIWGQPTAQRLIPLIDAAAEAGAEMFCIDAGWFGDETPPYKYAFEYGDWEESTDRFGEYKLQGILEYIKSRNMKPGIWLEIEVCGTQSRLSRRDDSWFLKRNGCRVGGGARYFLDYCNDEVCDYAMKVIDGLYQRGIRYIKNDYNDDFGIGCDYPDTAGSGDGMLKYIGGFYRFIDSVKRRYSDLTLENCASGAMRQDYGILSRFHLQSSSDQVIYDRYPSIVNGSLACILPEQLGVWSYPYPIEINDYDKPETLQTPAYTRRMADCEETIFNMVTGFCGSLYLSGHIDYADSRNFNLIKDAVAIYKSERLFIHSSFPFWPAGMSRINNKNCFLTQGLCNEKKTRALIAVWRRESSENTIEADLSFLGSGPFKVNQRYPEQDKGFDAAFYVTGDRLVVQLEKTNTARLFVVETI